jgi:DNA-binding Xre family transcriptional regulator
MIRCQIKLLLAKRQVAGLDIITLAELHRATGIPPSSLSRLANGEQQNHAL